MSRKRKTHIRIPSVEGELRYREAEIPSLATGEAFSAIYNAILDPGHYVEQLRSFPPPLRQMEPVARWQTRAVMAALGKLKERER